ncbi:MAG TPA: CAP domain-containing protein [Pseudomonas xinjiangensis]|uniref:CAP domain-containing protein n=2 Tax=root TaxID=1 RepID=A0A7V1FTZ2_9GAMM|nr:CAP domain-containing protein [Halopseudomonas xinjiangensis]HEC47143.1 CAP domain-containing protein [Halopseudomonas xinjiangensis]
MTTIRIFDRPAGIAAFMLFGVGMFGAAGVSAEPSSELVKLINEYRASSPTCKGKQFEAGPLAPSESLASVKLEPGAPWQQAMQQAGYQAGAAQAISLSGPSDAADAMTAIKQRYCEVLLDPQYAEIGVSRMDDGWQVIVARPLVSESLRDWMDAGQAVLRHVNKARRSPRTCGDQSFEAASPLTWDPRLGRAALEHSNYMAEAGVLSHADAEGVQVDTRVDNQGYDYRYVGENVAVGQGSAEQVVAGWLHSAGHCANIMNPEFTDMGAAYVNEPETSIYWTQVFARPSAGD